MDVATMQKYEKQLFALQASLEAESSVESSPVELDTCMGRVSRGDAMQVQQMALEMKRRREEQLLREGFINYS